MVERVDSGNHPKLIHKSAIILNSHCVLISLSVICVGANLEELRNVILISKCEKLILVEQNIFVV